MPVYKSKEQTKDGRSWFFKCQYKDAYGETHPKKIKKIYVKKRCGRSRKRILAKLWRNSFK